jgi:hypothetical protein
MRGINVRRGFMAVVVVYGISACGGGHSPAQGADVTPVSGSYAKKEKITIDSGSTKRIMTTRVLVRDAQSRMEFTSDMLRDTSGTVMVYDAKDQTMTTIVPRAKTAMIMKKPAFDFTPGDLPKVTVAPGSRREMIDLGAGEPILGFPTHRYRLTGASTSTVTYADRICTTTHASADDLWMTNSSDAEAIEKATEAGEMFGASTKQLSRRSHVDSATVRYPKGVTMRSITYDTTTDATGTRTVTSYATEVVELSRAPLDSMLFKTPADFQIMDMRGITISGDMSKILKQTGKPLAPGCVAKR